MGSGGELVEPRFIDHRSIPLESYDIGPAAIAAARLPDNSVGDRLFTSPVDGELVAELSDYTWSRMNTYNLSPGYLAYLDEVCSTYTHWELGSLEDQDPVATFLDDFHQPCLQSSVFPVAEMAAPELSCVIYSELDPFSGEIIAGRWASKLDAHTIEREGAAHGTNNLTPCFDSINTITKG